MRGRTGAIRQQALKGSDFVMAEKHGKRLDVMGPARKVREDPPLVYGSLDLAAARKKWMEGVHQQGETEALHMVIQWPTDIPMSPFKAKQMLEHSVRFANRYHGGDAVFAARLDQDEKGRHTVDVFAMPRYDFTYKDGRTVKRAATSKFAKEHARERHQELTEPGEKLAPDSPVVQGRALQAAWHEYLRDEVKLGDWVKAPTRKKQRTKDRLEPEELALKREREKVRADALLLKAEAEAEALEIKRKARGTVVEALAELDRRGKSMDEREKAIERDAAILSAARRLEKAPPVPEVDRLAQRGRERRKGLER